MQLELALRDEQTLHLELERHAGVPIHLTLTDNSSSLLTVKPQPGRRAIMVRAHRMFLHADSQVVKALAAWVTKPRCPRSGAVIDSYIRSNRHLIRPRQRRRIVVCTRGRVFDLQSIYDEVKHHYFDDTITAAITWGRFPRPKRQRSIRFGSYTVESNLIRIHPYLDQEFVPEFYVRYIVFHEMLHAYLGIEEGPTGRRRIHTREFNQAERAYPDYPKALAWESNPQNIRRLLKRT
ncbi:MAG: hypothetical protein AMXMBFR84_43200 [Candidatus Hydrogenedentota bacterium]